MNFSGNIFDYVVAYWGGVLVSFTPCLYPLLPITAGLIAGANSKGTKTRGFVLSLIYVLGVAVTYCVLAAFAALSGRVFGQLQNSPAVYLTVGVILIFFAFVMFDLIRLPNLGIQINEKIRPKNIWTVFLFGMISGLVVGPCTAPVLGSLLFYVASKQNIIHGVSLLFVFSYGVGTSLIIVGTFSGLVARLPKSGPWLIAIKKISGAILFAIGVYFLLKGGQLII